MAQYEDPEEEYFPAPSQTSQPLSEVAPVVEYLPGAQGKHVASDAE